MTNPDRDPEPSSAAEPDSGGSEPTPGAYETPAYGQAPGYQQPGYPPPPPGYQPYGSFGNPYDTSGGYPPPAGYGPYPGGYGGAPRTNALAIWSLVASLVGFVCCLGSVAGIVLGLVSLNQIKQNNEEGQGLAIAGIAVGAVSLLAGVVMAVVIMNS